MSIKPDNFVLLIPNKDTQVQLISSGTAEEFSIQFPSSGSGVIRIGKLGNATDALAGIELAPGQSVSFGGNDLGGTARDYDMSQYYVESSVDAQRVRVMKTVDS